MAETMEPRRLIDIVTEELGCDQNEVTYRARLAGWNPERFKNEIQTPGWQDRLASAVDAGISSKITPRVQQLVSNALKTGPSALEHYSVAELASFIQDPNLRVLAERYVPHRDGNRLVLGPTGIGKSVAGVASLRREAERVKRLSMAHTAEVTDFTLADAVFDERRQPIAWIRAFDLPTARLAYGLGEGEAPLVHLATTTKFIVLDDLGWESRRAGADDVVAEVIATRNDRGLLTYATSGQRIEQLEERYGDAVVRKLTNVGNLKGKVVSFWPKETRH